MPIQIGMKKLPSQAEIAAKEKEKQEKKLKAQKENLEKKAKKDSTKTRKRQEDLDALLFGSALFEPIAKKEKEIIIIFRGEKTKQGLHISKCGRFAYERTGSDFYFNLYYFLDGILEYNEDIEIVPSDRNWLFDSLTCDELKECVINLKRAEYEDEKIKALEEIKKKEEERRIENERIDAEFEAEQEKEKAQVSLLDAQEDRIECGTVISIPNEPTLNEVPAIEDKIKKATEEIKPALGSTQLLFRKIVRKG